MSEAPCAVDGCENEARRRGYCWAHLKRLQKGQELGSKIQTKPKSPMERLTEAIHAYVDADGDDEFELARKALLRAVSACRPAVSAELIRAGLDRARANGVRLGRPRTVCPNEIRVMVAKVGVRGTARALGIARSTVQRVASKSGDFAACSQR